MLRCKGKYSPLCGTVTDVVLYVAVGWNDKDSPVCSPVGSVVQCVVGNPMRQSSSVMTQIRLDASHLPATRSPLYIAINVTTSVCHSL